MVHWSKKRESEYRIDLAKDSGFYQGIADLVVYLQSEKFSVDTTVQARDVLNRIQSAKDSAEFARSEQEGIERERGNID